MLPACICSRLYTMPDLSNLKALITRLAVIDFSQGSEQATREMAVNPVIGALGWDTFNPEEVAREYSVRGGRVGGLRDDVPDFRKCVRTITLDPLSEFIYWRMNWHLEHHMFAGVPCYNLKKLHRAVAHDMPRPRTFLGAWREMREIWHRQQEDPGYQFDTPLPAAAEAPPAQAEEAASIGDLAPQELR